MCASRYLPEQSLQRFLTAAGPEATEIRAVRLPQSQDVVYAVSGHGNGVAKILKCNKLALYLRKRPIHGTSRQLQKSLAVMQRSYSTNRRHEGLPRARLIAEPWSSPITRSTQWFIGRL